jgi:hypothetical protein
MLKGWPSVLGKSLRPLAQGAKPTTQVPACQPVEPCVSQQSDKFLLQQSRKFLLETGKLAG